MDAQELYVRPVSGQPR